MKISDDTLELIFRNAIEEGRIDTEGLKNAIRIAKRMLFEEKESEEEVEDTLSKTFELYISEIKQIINIAKKYELV